MSLMIRHVRGGVERGVVGEVVEIVERLHQAFGVRVVGPEEHVLDADEVDQLGDVVLPERVDEHVAAERFDRMFVEALRHAPVGELELVEQVPDPVGAVLDAHPVTGAGRINTALAPWSSTQSSSLIASSTMGSVITGVVKMQSW